MLDTYRYTGKFFVSLGMLLRSGHNLFNIYLAFMRFILLFFVLIFSLTVGAQETKISYFDAAWNKTTKPRATYYRESIKEDRAWQVKDFYISGQLQMEGTYKPKDKKNGFFTFYHKTGEKLTEGICKGNKRTGEWTYWYNIGEVERKGMYANDYVVGEWLEFHKNGELRAKGSYTKGHRDGDWTWWYDNGQMKTEGSYNMGKKTGGWNAFYKNGAIDFIGVCEKGKKVDEWKWYHENGQVSSKEIYENDEVVSFEMWNKGGEKEEGKLGNMPDFVDGISALMYYLDAHIVYPTAAKKDKITGTVLVDFFVSETGEVESVTIAYAIHPLLDAEALRVVKTMPNWQVGRQHNRVTRMLYVLPVFFGRDFR
ncbi:MAG: TonB family protein [Flavobacteriales bacterium]|nr:TonB family protein [Flavobacteriales bacterium]